MRRNGYAFRRIQGVVLAAGVVVAAAACETEDPVSLLNNGRDIRNFAVIPGGGPTPSGSMSIDAFTVVGFDEAVPDGFARATGGPVGYDDPTDPGGAYGSGSDLFYVPDIEAGNATADPRLPTLGGDVHAADLAPFGLPPWSYIQGPSWGGYFEFWGYMAGLEVGKKYFVGLARYGLEVNGKLDQVEMLLDGTVSQPDRLVFLGGSPAGHFDSGPNWTSDAPAGCWDPPDSNTNPWILGYVVGSDLFGLGMTVPDFCWVPGDVYYSTPGEGRSPFANNDLSGDFSLPTYNYLVIWEEDPATGLPDYDRPVWRVQFGADLDANGEPVNNAFAPFPRTKLSTDELAVLPGAISAPSGLTVTVTNLEALTSGEYRAWLVNPATGARTEAIGEYTVTTAEGTSTPVTTSSFKGGDGTHTLVVSDALTSEPIGGFTHVVIAEGDVAEPLWAQFTDQKGTPDDFSDDEFFTSASLSFGSFGATPQTYQIAGSGEGAFYLDSLVVQLRRVPQPPPGFYYQGWVIDSKTGAAAPTNAVTLDPLGDGFDRAAARDVGGSFDSYDTYVLTLEAELGDPGKPSPTKVQVSEEGGFVAARSQ